MNNNFQRYEGETDDELIYRVCKSKDAIGTWDDVKNILNELLGTDFGESTFRKKFQSFEKMFNANQKVFSDSKETLEEINNQIRELKKERYKVAAEKLENNKYIRENARDELIVEKIVDAISSLEPKEVPEYTREVNDDRSAILAFTDCHFGVEFCVKDLFGNVVNEYSPEIFERRMWDMLDSLIDIIARESLEQLEVWELGDSISGILRLNSQLMQLRYGVIDSALKYAEFLATWLNELSYYVKIKFQIVKDSNHSQLRLLGQPKNSFPDENMSKVIIAFLKERLKNNPNIEFIENPTGMCFSNVEGYNVLGCHGEVKNLLDSVNSFSRAYGTNIDYVIAGHVHHQNVKETGKHSEVLTVRSMVGTDDYAMSMNKTSDAGASLYVFNREFGKIASYDLKVK